MGIEYVSVWKGIVGVGEMCILMDGCYLGIKTGQLYPTGEYRHSPVYRARVVASTKHETGMYYREEYDHADLIGQEVEVEKAHRFKEFQVWRTTPNVAYLSENEIKLLSEGPVR